MTNLFIIDEPKEKFFWTESKIQSQWNRQVSQHQSDYQCEILSVIKK